MSPNSILIICNSGTRDSEVVERALRLLKGKKSKLFVVDVVKSLPLDSLTNFEATKVEILQHAVVEERKNQLNAFIKHFKHKNIEVNTKVLTGQFTIQIIEEVNNNKIDLVMLTADGIGPIKDQLFGAKSMNLIRRCPCPVWVLKPIKIKKCREILAAVDPSCDGVEGNLNEKIIEFAMMVARMDKSKLHLVHACDFYAENLLKESPFMHHSDVEEMAHHVWGEHKSNYDALVSKYDFDGIDLEQHYEKGEAAEIITNIANREEVDLVVMGTVNRINYKGLLIGSTAERVCYQVNSSILALKPEGFVEFSSEIKNE